MRPSDLHYSDFSRMIDAQIESPTTTRDTYASQQQQQLQTPSSSSSSSGLLGVTRSQTHAGDLISNSRSRISPQMQARKQLMRPTTTPQRSQTPTSTITQSQLSQNHATVRYHTGCFALSRSRGFKRWNCCQARDKLAPGCKTGDHHANYNAFFIRGC